MSDRRDQRPAGTSRSTPTKSRGAYVGCSVQTTRAPGRETAWLRLQFRARGRQVSRALHLADNAENRRRAQKIADLVAAAIRAGCGLTEIDEMLGHRPLQPVEIRTATLTLETAYHRWMDATGAAVRPRSRVKRRWAMQSFILSRFGHRELSSITSADVQGLQAELLQTKPIATVEAIIISGWRSMWTWCHQQHPPLVAVPSTAIFGGLRWPASKQGNPEPFTPDERDRIIAYLDEHHTQRDAAFVHLLFWSGMRPSEASALTWANVDVSGCQLWVVASRVEGQVNAPKTTSARRRVELHPDSAARIAALRTTDDLSAAVFAGQRGVINTAAFGKKVWRRTLSALGIRHRGVYATKDTFVSLHISAGVPPAWIEEQTGVAWSTLRRHYGRWIPGERRLFVATDRIRSNN